ncbi:bifunctional helix-turn-helix transcriptional regulator/GNAT family N-acetyltransferase [Undibacter mobilis]|uniref:MarR family transcriptional regulator n=1 Tax=Undibacter mobilis TaxID=2292256 RepID=A0A371B4B3_9BRAD|nr:helix-turn-helix domain-containing GNAT family N-acetyltransferase [Undibacter mobilis]RDV02428.1 MarR family transcriptional regulator [Undibacter mobilis]
MPAPGQSKQPAKTKAAPPADHVAAVRRFNRFYTRQIGLLRKTYLDTPYSLGEMRVLHELAHPSVAQPTAKDIGRALDLDAGYLSRVLRNFEKRGLIKRTTSKDDARQSHLSLTAQGRKFFAPAEKRSDDDVAAMLTTLSESEQSELVAAMHRIERLLEKDNGSAAPRTYTLRDLKPGDLGWIVAEHARVYTREYNWDHSFEALVAQIVANFAENFDPAMERCWIAEMDGEPIGSVMLVKDEKPGTARIRLLIVSPKARGLGLGQRLTDECIAFARAKGYRAITLWTHECLTAARRCYQKRGFTLTSSENKMSFGQNVVAEFWDKTL